MTEALAANSDISMTQRAAERLGELAAADPARSVLRIQVEGGGCSGFQYKLDLVAAPEADDLIIERDSARVVIDAVSIAYMAGSQIDFVDDLIGSSFRVNNPRAIAACGCGTSFSI